MTESPTVSALAVALADLPVRVRVHELAKRAGMSSREVLAALAERGTPASSASSAVAAEIAVDLLTGWLGDDAPASQLPAADLPQADPALPAPGDPVAVGDTLIAPDLVAATRMDPTGAPQAEPDAAADASNDADAGGDGTDPAPAGRRRRRSGGGRRRAAATAGSDAPDGAVGAPDATPEATAESDDATGAAEPGPVATAVVAPLLFLDAAPAAVAIAVSAEPIDAGDQSDGDDDETGADETGGDAADGRRRRRRGRRSRGRGTERADADSETPAASATAGGTGPDGADGVDGEAETPAADDETGEEPADETTEGGTRRRRRRRRRGGAGEDSGTADADDPDDTVVHVRSSRASGSDEVQGVRGSTRLEAKRQRRRDTRDTRRRPQILSEAEFLARRESVERVMAVRQRGPLSQVALLEDGVLVEHFVSKAGTASLMGAIFLGQVQNVLPSMEAAFVDIGKGRNAVIYAGEVNWDAAGLAGKARRIESALSPGDTILAQVTKDPVGQKGARLTTQISLAGRFLVYVPNGGATGISRKLPDTERRRLKSILDRIVPEDAGVIIRTAAENVPEEELVRDVERLQEQWTQIQQAAAAPGAAKSKAPQQLSQEPDTLIKVVRDLFNSDITRLVIDGDSDFEAVSDYVGAVAPELADRVSRWDGDRDVFAAYRVDEQIAKALERKVHLPSGGSLVIDRTEAMTVVDVNTGKYTGSGGNLEETVTRNNLEAAEEIVRQLRLRDIGGIIVVDFIDMVLESNRELVLRRLTECLGRDRTRHQVAEVTSLGLVQMTRKKMGTGLVEAFSEPCPHCGGRGILLHDMPAETTEADEVEDTERRPGRGRRDRRARSEPAEPVARRVVATTVRPPDPRGPKPPELRGSESDDESGSDAVGSDPVEQVGAPGVDDPDGTEVTGDQAGAQDGALSDVTAVLAALDARVDGESVPVSAAGWSDLPAGGDAEPGTGADETIPAATPATEARPTDVPGADAPATAGRRRGRRSAGRPAGAPSVVTAPVEPAVQPGPATSDQATPEPPVDGHLPVDDTSGPAVPDGPSAPAAASGRPRRRRAASRPAGPAGAVAVAVAGVAPADFVG